MLLKTNEIKEKKDIKFMTVSCIKNRELEHWKKRQVEMPMKLKLHIKRG